MSYTLKSRNILITGGSRGLGALTAEKFAREGANVVVNYVSAKGRADEVVKKLESFGVRAVAVQADVGKASECKKLVEESIAALGGLDIIISNAGWTKIGAFPDLEALSEDDWDKCWSVNVKANLHLLQAAKATFNSNPEGGALLISSSIASATPAGSSMAYSVSKAAGLHLMKCLAASQGPKIRVNAIQPGLLLTEWGLGFPKDKIEGYKNKATLGILPEVEECAEAFVLMAKSKGMTGAALKIDSGLAPMA